MRNHSRLTIDDTSRRLPKFSCSTTYRKITVARENPPTDRRNTSHTQYASNLSHATAQVQFSGEKSAQNKSFTASLDRDAFRYLDRFNHLSNRKVLCNRKTHAIPQKRWHAP